MPADLSTTSPEVQNSLLQEKLESALGQLEQARSFAKARHQSAGLELAGRLMTRPGGLDHLYRLAPRLEDGGLFAGTDWADPSALVPGLVRSTLDLGEKKTVVLDCLSQLRLLAVANGVPVNTSVTAVQARHFLTQVLALNLNRIFGAADESLRVRLGPLGGAVNELFRFLLEQYRLRGHPGQPDRGDLAHPDPTADSGDRCQGHGDPDCGGLGPGCR